MGWFTGISNRAKQFGEIVAALTIVGTVLFWAFEPRYIEYLDDRLGVSSVETRGGPCVVFPSGGHVVEGGFIGEWATIQWYDLTKLRDDCGRPDLSAVISNGDGILHDAPLSIEGVIIPLGNFDLTYDFLINDRVRPGSGRFRVTVTYPDAVGGAPPGISPWVPFYIRESD